jgi:hypothetical protein
VILAHTLAARRRTYIALHSLWSLYHCLTGMHEKYVKNLSPKAIGPKDMLHNFIFNNTRRAAKNREKIN